MRESAYTYIILRKIKSAPQATNKSIFRFSKAIQDNTNHGCGF